MPFEFATLLEDQILHTKVSGVVTNQELIDYYRMIHNQVYREKYFIELVNGAKITRMCVDEDGHKQLSALIGGTVQKLIKNIELLKADKIQISELYTIYPKLLTNEFRLEKFSKALGLSKNQKQAQPPNDPEKILAILNAYLDSFLNGRLAMLGKTPEVIEVFLDWKEKSKNIGYSVEVFEDLAQACTWLLKIDKN